MDKDELWNDSGYTQKEMNVYAVPENFMDVIDNSLYIPKNM